jgi:hypothetical protein
MTAFPTMTLFANARITRRIASVMLVFWLLALGAAWANACSLQERGTHLHLDAAAHAGTLTVSVGHGGVLDDHGAGSSTGKAACLKACDDESQSIVQGQASLDLLDLAMVPPTQMARTPKVAALDAPRIANFEHPARAGPPLRTRYSRLAL